MAWYFDILLGFAVSTAFLLGGILYIWSRDEVDTLFGNLKNAGHTKTILVVSAFSAGILLSVLFAWKEIASLVLFVMVLTLGSIAYVGDEKIVAIEYSAASMLIFFVGFLAAYLFRI